MHAIASKQYFLSDLLSELWSDTVRIALSILYEVLLDKVRIYRKRNEFLTFIYVFKGCENGQVLAKAEMFARSNKSLSISFRGLLEDIDFSLGNFEPANDSPD